VTEETTEWQFGDMANPPHVFESRFKVRSYELDGFAHMNHAVFLNWFEQARFDVFEAGGFPAPQIQARGWGVYVVKLEVEYLKEAKLGDELVVRSWVEDVARSAMTFHQVASPAEQPDTISAEARVRAVWIGTDRRPTRIPAEVRVALGWE
jgi:YbgC/YbaW family acyl-CoA thioester hydrolase